MSASTENGFSQWEKLIESSRNKYKSHTLHFLVISIFFFPIIFSLIVYPSLHLYLFHNNQIISITVYTLFLILFFICGVATTTYSAVEAYCDRPINVLSSIKSIRNSFFPLLSTFIVIHTIFILIALPFVIILVIFYHRILQNDSNQLLYLVIFELIVLVPILIWLQVKWSLCYVITIVESKKGYETLKRSEELMKDMRWIGFWILMYFGFVILGMIVICAKNSVYSGKGWVNLGFIVLLIALGSVLGFILMIQYFVANVGLYMYCKEFNDEKLSSENAAAGDYVSLPLDEEEKKNDGIV